MFRSIYSQAAWRWSGSPRRVLWLAALILAPFSGHPAANAQCGNQPPLAQDDTALTCGFPILIDVLANDSDPNGNLLGVSLVSNDCDGAVTLIGDLVQLTPSATWSASCTIDYRATDENGSQNTATVSVSAPVCAGIFDDGFETGNTSQWSSTEGGA